MARIISLNTHADNRGKLTVVEQHIPFSIKRIFYIYSMDDSMRGGHRHKLTRQALICLKGKCTVTSNNGNRADEFLLDEPGKCLLLEPEDWHQLRALADDTILMVLASELFDPDDYVFSAYP